MNPKQQINLEKFTKKGNTISELKEGANEIQYLFVLLPVSTSSKERVVEEILGSPGNLSLLDTFWSFFLTFVLPKKLVKVVLLVILPAKYKGNNSNKTNIQQASEAKNLK